jgi:hypothetical protein
MDVSTTRDQSVDTQQGGGFCPTSPFSGVGSRDSLEVFVFLPLQESVKIFGKHLRYTLRDCQALQKYADLMAELMLRVRVRYEWAKESYALARRQN